MDENQRKILNSVALVAQVARAARGDDNFDVNTVAGEMMATGASILSGGMSVDTARMEINAMLDAYVAKLESEVRLLKMPAANRAAN